MQTKVAYEDAIRTKYPEPVVIAVARDARGRDNPITLNWAMITSHEPPMMAVSIGLTRYSLKVIRAAGAFVVAFASEEMASEALFHGTHSGREMDKLEACGTATQPATQIDCALLADAVANFECRVEGELLTGDHVIFAGRVVAAHRHEGAPKGRLYTLGNNYEMGGVGES